MSNWTHVVGAMMIDASANSYRERAKNLKKLEDIFIQSTFELYYEDCNMPKGSEGSIQKEIVFEDSLSCSHQFSILFRGNLRDFGGWNDESLEDIRDWFTKSFKDIVKKGMIVRQATLYATDGYRKLTITKDSYEKPIITITGEAYIHE